MPYRTNANNLSQTTTDSSEVKHWKGIHDRYANLEDKLWKLPSGDEADLMTEIFAREEYYVKSAVSPDGERIVVVGGGRGWCVDRSPLRCTPLGAWPKVERLRLDDRGHIAAYINGDTVFIRDLEPDARPRRLRLTDPPKWLSLSADGSMLVVTAAHRVYVFDTTIDELIYSFEQSSGADWSQVCVHSSGELILTYGKDLPTNLVGREGLLRELPQCNAACFNRSGTLLALGADGRTNIYRIGTDPADWQLLPDFSFEGGLPVTFSPDDKLLLVTAQSGKVIDLVATKHAYQNVAVLKTTMTTIAAFGAGFFGERLFLPLEEFVRTPSGGHRCGGVICALEDGSRLGGISITSVQGQSRLIGFTRGGLFGCLAGDRLIEPETPFERPGIIASVLFDGEQHLSAEDSLLHYEHVERDAYCRDIASRLLPGVDYRELLPLLHRLLHLSPAIVRRASELSQEYRRFGPVQVTHVGIRRACEELLAISPFEREQRFEQMLETLRRSPSRPSDSKAPRTVIPSMREH